MQIAPLESWVAGYSKPLVITGPCSVESPQQFHDTLQQLLPLQPHFIRGGIWKPRTRPGSFEGIGAKALDWVNREKQDNPFHFATEVATPEHAEHALASGADLLWIGARTTVNPFQVQQIADAVAGKDVAVFVKNPINPDLALWRGAIERFAKAGITKLGAIHRGFHVHHPSRFRNEPLWQIPLDLKSELPGLPLICDPSHITGKRDMIFEIAQRALDLNFDGLMIESHCQPDEALSDAAQQVTPEALANIFQSLTLRSGSFSEDLVRSQLEVIREEIDRADHDIIEALAKRLNLVEQIGSYKKENNVAIFQLSRWKEIFKSRPQWAKSLDLDEEFIRDLYRLIHQQSVKRQTTVFNKKDQQADHNE